MSSALEAMREFQLRFLRETGRREDGVAGRRTVRPEKMDWVMEPVRRYRAQKHEAESAPAIVSTLE